MLDQTTVSRDEIDKRAELIRTRLSGIRPDFPTALGMLGLAVLQLGELGATESNIREAVDLWLTQHRQQQRSIAKPAPAPADVRHIMSNWLRQTKG